MPKAQKVAAVEDPKGAMGECEARLLTPFRAPKSAATRATVAPGEVPGARMAGALQAPLAKLAALRQARVGSLGYALGAYRDKVTAGAPATADAPAEPTSEPAPEAPEAAAVPAADGTAAEAIPAEATTAPDPAPAAGT